MDIIIFLATFLFDVVMLGLLITGLLSWMYGIHIYRTRHSPTTKLLIAQRKAVRRGR